MRSLRLVAATTALVSLAAVAQSPAPAGPAMPAGHPPAGASPHAKAAPSPWSEFADYAITVKTPPKGATGTWSFRTFADPGDVAVEFDAPDAKGRAKGSILLVGGSAIAVKGFAPDPGFEADMLDVAILNLKMATQLLDLALPAGPSALKASLAVSAKDAGAPIAVSTPGATARFGTPWTLKGKIERAGAQAVSFQLEVEAPGGDKPGERSRWTFSGKASGSTKGRVLEDSTSLAGWTAYALGSAQPAKEKSHTALRFGATKLPGPFATLKELRAALK